MSCWGYMMTRDLAPERALANGVVPVHTWDIVGGGGITLRAHEWGNPAGPAMLFIHGWSQCDRCWSAQVADTILASRFRMVTFDNRGHGESEKPLVPGCYADGQRWADDLAAVIEQTHLERPVLVAWSYGGFIVADYLRAYGDGEIAGIDLVGAALLLRPLTFDHIGPGFLANAPEACAPDLGANIQAIRRFLRACTARPLDSELWDTVLSWNMVVPPDVRGALIGRELDSTDVFGRVTVPVLVTHGRQDAIILPSMAEYALEQCPTASPSWYEGVGHMPFVEDPERFNRELAEFVDRARA
jgi:non-heme chloroperoxidase